MKQLRVGILGQGRSGYGIHAKWLMKDRERFKIVAVSDPMPERVTECAEEFGAKAFEDYHALIADRDLNLDLIVNALPSHLHPEGSVEALQAGYHVICEKPLARTVADFDRMVAAADAAGKRLLPFQNSRFQPAFMKIQELLASGVLGRLIHGRISFSGFARRWDWQVRRDFWGGNLLNTGPHPMDQAVVLFGESMPNVFARLVCDNPFGDAENFATVTLWGKQAPTIEVLISSFLAYKQGEMYNFSCTHGGIEGNFNELRWRYFDPSVAQKQSTTGTWSDNRGYCGEKLEWREESWKWSEPEMGNTQVLCRGFYSNSYDILVNNAQRVIKLDQVRRQVAVMEEAHRQNPDLL